MRSREFNSPMTRQLYGSLGVYARADLPPGGSLGRRCSRRREQGCFGEHAWRKFGAPLLKEGEHYRAALYYREVIEAVRVMLGRTSEGASHTGRAGEQGCDVRVGA